MSEARALLRHCVATLAYRASKVVRDLPESVADFRPSDSSRTPHQIVSHLGDLMEWALSMAEGHEAWINGEPLSWQETVDRFFGSLGRFDAFLASDAELAVPAERLFQGPIADALTHVGQIAYVRRIAEAPIRGENYFVADVSVGRVGAEQADPKFEFD